MSIADHFDHAPDAGFVRSYDLRSARRQFQVSLILIVILDRFGLRPWPAGSLRSACGRFASPSRGQHDVHFAGVMPDLTGFAPRS